MTWKLIILELTFTFQIVRFFQRLHSAGTMNAAVLGVPVLLHRVWWLSYLESQQNCHSHSIHIAIQSSLTIYVVNEPLFFPH